MGIELFMGGVVLEGGILFWCVFFVEWKEGRFVENKILRWGIFF